MARTCLWITRSLQFNQHVILNEVKDLLWFYVRRKSRSFAEFTLEHREGFRMTLGLNSREGIVHKKVCAIHETRVVAGEEQRGFRHFFQFAHAALHPPAPPEISAVFPTRRPAILKLISRQRRVLLFQSPQCVAGSLRLAAGP